MLRKRSGTHGANNAANCGPGVWVLGLALVFLGCQNFSLADKLRIQAVLALLKNLPTDSMLLSAHGRPKAICLFNPIAIVMPLLVWKRQIALARGRQLQTACASIASMSSEHSWVCLARQCTIPHAGRSVTPQDAQPAYQVRGTTLWTRLFLRRIIPQHSAPHCKIR